MAAPKGNSLGEQELELLRWVAQHGPATVGEVAESFGAPLNLSRSTVVTVMERLRKKGFLTRNRQEGVYRYASPVAQEALLNGLVHRFVERTLAGSLSPLIAYFANTPELTADEMAQLEGLIARLEARKRQEEQGGAQ